MKTSGKLMVWASWELLLLSLGPCWHCLNKFVVDSVPEQAQWGPGDPEVAKGFSKVFPKFKKALSSARVREHG